MMRWCIALGALALAACPAQPPSAARTAPAARSSRISQRICVPEIERISYAAVARRFKDTPETVKQVQVQGRHLLVVGADGDKVCAVGDPMRLVPLMEQANVTLWFVGCPDDDTDMSFDAFLVKVKNDAVASVTLAEKLGDQLWRLKIQLRYRGEQGCCVVPLTGRLRKLLRTYEVKLERER